eukprot:NODE_26532_length_547_cov_4.569048.p2 GENE.NODE_26532_length_547_cov_4.569048~~NODE_26532_length_547_cov_4.569048.p2  ORF type:complete len:55 (+),score=16.36 NODE_26532_length_547_cov_4.569048:201-365(+)
MAGECNEGWSLHFVHIAGITIGIITGVYVLADTGIRRPSIRRLTALGAALFMLM